MRTRTILVVACTSLSLLSIELIWTRLLSAEFFYTFAFLVLSLAVLGLGLGALALRLYPALATPQRLGYWLTATGLCALVAPVAVFRLGIDFSLLFADPVMVIRFIAFTLLLMSAFFFGGMSLALVFRAQPGRMPGLYMADLLGAGTGVLLAIWAMNIWGTPTATLLSALPVLLAAVWVSAGAFRFVAAFVAAAAVILSPSASPWLEAQHQERAPVIYKHWDAMAKIKVYDFGTHRGINIDNVANSPVYPFDGNWGDLDTTETEWGIDVSYLIRKFDSCVFLSLGSGGGTDVLQALAEGATDVHAVEVNPHINFMMIHDDPDGYMPPPAPADSAVADSTIDSLRNDSTVADTAWQPIPLAEYSGHIYRDPRVRVVTEDARAYVRRHPGTFDVIYSLSSNSWAALASGALALAENYLFTTEAFIDYWRALTDSGFMMMEHQMYMPRLVTEVTDALRLEAVAHPEEHFAIYDLPQMRRKMMLLSKRPLDDEIRNHAFGELTPETFDAIHLLYPAATDSLKGNLIYRIVAEGWGAVADSAPIDLRPVTDDRPFIAQMGLWRNVTRERLDRVVPYADFSGFPLSQIILLTILGIVLVLVIPLNLWPFMRSGPRLSAAAWLYFFTIGAAFMAAEVVLIQKYGLLIGPSLYSVSTVLVTLLVAAGLGSRVSLRVPAVAAFAGIVCWLFVDALLFRRLIPALGEMSQGWRIVAAALWLSPGGFFLGMPFPRAAVRVGELVDWGFAVNGSASVLGSTLALFAAFQFGFTAVLIATGLAYGLAYLLLSRVPATTA